MHTQLINLTKQNVSSIYSLSDFMVARGNWTADRDIREDTAKTIYGLFQVLAWSDRGLHHNECNLLDVAIDIDKSHGNHLEKLIGSEPIDLDTETRVPGLLAAAALHDSVHDTRFVNLVMNSLENLGLLILMADAEISESETAAYQSYFSKLRRSFSAVPMAGRL
ncbi:MAG: hypothetical protein ABL949_05650 [Fimbriimonadaceae bacterium]